MIIKNAFRDKRSGAVVVHDPAKWMQHHIRKQRAKAELAKDRSRQAEVSQLRNEIAELRHLVKQLTNLNRDSTKKGGE